MLALLVLALALPYALPTSIPAYIQVCKRNDPHVEDCIISSVEKLKPKLRDGIEEMGVPPMEPMHLPEVMLSKTPTFRAMATNLVVHGASDFSITYLKSQMMDNAITFDIGMYLPKMVFEGEYDVAGRLMVLPLNGKGPLTAAANDVEGTAQLKASVRMVNGVKMGHFDTLTLKLKISSYSVRMDNLFGGDTALGDAINSALNDNKRQVMRILLPTFERITSDILLSNANKIMDRYPIDELFPAE